MSKGPRRSSREKGPEPHWISGRHVVEEALASRHVRVLTVWIFDGDKDHSQELVRLAGRNGAAVRFVPRVELDRVTGRAPHQGLAARVVEKSGRGLEEYLAGLSEEKRKSLVLAALDQIQDPQNYGAIARSAAGLGVDAILSTERRAAPLSAAVLRASAGAAQRIPTLRVVNLAQTLLRLKDQGFWIYGADMTGTPAWEATLNRPMVLVIGSEGKGLRPLVRSYCDELIAVPQVSGGPSSLNASCAASVLFYEAARQNRAKS